LKSKISSEIGIDQTKKRKIYRENNVGSRPAKGYRYSFIGPGIKRKRTVKKINITMSIYRSLLRYSYSLIAVSYPLSSKYSL
jgi:hypothetical protein